MLDGDGKVGIGVTDPGAKLHVNGTIKLDGNYPVGTSNVIIGDGAGENIASGGSQHTAVGNLALYKVASTNRSTAVGDQAGRWSEGYYNTFIGAEAGKGANGTHTSNSNIAIGTQALQQVTSGSNNIAIGAWTGGSPASMAINSSGAKNTAVGVGTLGNNTTASNSTAIGFQALQANNANDNTAVGFEAMLVSDSGGATENTAIGSRSMKSNRSGDGNTAAGRESLLNNVSGGDNVAIGKLAMAVNNSGNQNVAVGNEALRLNSSGNQNVAVGRESAYNNNSNYTTIVGHQAGYTANNTAATFNTLFGYQAGYSNISGSANTFIGPYSGYYMTGNNNTILGRYNGNQDGLDIRTSSNNVVLSDGAGNIRLRIDTNGKVGINNTSPLSALAIYDSGASAYSSTVDSTSNMSGIRLSASPNQNVSAGIWFGTGGDQTGSHWSGIAGSRTNYTSDWGTRLSFYTHPTATTSASETYERMTIDPSGNVGIGTTSPIEALDVDGAIISGNSSKPINATYNSGGNMNSFEHRFNRVKAGAGSPHVLVDIQFTSNFHQAMFVVEYGARLQAVSDSTTNAVIRSFGVNRFNGNNCNVTETNNTHFNSNVSSHAPIYINVVSQTRYQIVVNFSGTLGGSSFVSGSIRGYGVNSEFPTITFSDGMNGF